MRIRTQLILAAFLLAVVPLAAIVTYSYHSSRQALESAYRREADRLTGQMDKRLALIRAELDQRLAFASALPIPHERGGTDVRNIVTVMGDSAGLVDALEFHPVPSPPAQVRVMVRERVVPNPSPTPAPAPMPREDPAAVEVAAAPPAPPAAPSEPIVIDIPAVPNFPRFVMSESQKEAIEEVSKLGLALSKQHLSEEERADLRAELNVAQQELQRAMADSREVFEAQMREAQQARRERQQATEQALQQSAKARIAQLEPPAPVAAVRPVKVKPVVVREPTAKDIERSAATAKKATLILGRHFDAPVRQQGELVGQLSARISPDQVIQRVLGGAADDRSEIPFAIDREGTLYTRNTNERTSLEQLGIPDRIHKGQSLKGLEGWIVSTSTDAPSGMKIGVARPVGENFDDLRRTAGRNFAIGLGLIVFALIGIVPFSNHLARDVKIVTEGADRIAHGDLMTRLPVKNKNNELGQLARAFNRMAEDLSLQQQKLLEQERTRKEQEIQQRLLAVEYDRKTFELEEARRFQLSMLAKEVPHHPAYDVAVFTRTATEVGGDYYDFRLAGDVLSATIGDATGHGAKAGTMVTVVKTLFAGYDGRSEPAAFLGDAAEKIKRMDLGRMAMALSLARFEGRHLTVASAGMPPALVHRAATRRIEEIVISSTPLGTLGTTYDQTVIELASGDTVLLQSDGFPELMNDAGQQLGYVGATDAFAIAALEPSAEAVIAELSAQSRAWNGEAAPDDDVTFVVVRVA